MSRKHDGKIVVFNPETGKVYLLNETAHIILNLCDGSNNQSDIASFMAKHFQVDLDLATKDVNEFLEEFRKVQLVL